MDPTDPWGTLGTRVVEAKGARGARVGGGVSVVSLVGSNFSMQGGRDWVLRLDGILPTGACLSFGFLFFGLFSYAAFFGPAVAEQSVGCAGAGKAVHPFLPRFCSRAVRVGDSQACPNGHLSRRTHQRGPFRSP